MIYLRAIPSLGHDGDHRILTFADSVTYSTATASLRVDAHWGLQGDILNMPRLALAFIRRVETIARGYLACPRPRPCQSIAQESSFKPLRTSPHNSWTLYYTQNRADRVYRAYERDFEIIEKQNAPSQLQTFIAERHAGNAGIVHCLSRAKVNETAASLASAGIPALAYHAGLEATMRARHQNRFINEDGVVIVATIAFGMGIDKPDVRFVAHLDLPKSITPGVMLIKAALICASILQVANPNAEVSH